MEPKKQIMRIKKTIKIYYFFIRYLKARISTKAFMVRFIPTNRCNLRCQYCWQWQEKGQEMTGKEFSDYLSKACELGVGLIDFMGGEPLSWKHIFYAIEECDRHNIITNLNTNGTLLNEVIIDQLGRAGLDHLNVSIDGTKKTSITKKCLEDNEQLITCLQRANRKWGIKVRVNSVIHKSNFDDLKKLIGILYENQIPLTLGFVVPPLGYKSRKESNIFFSSEDEELLRNIVSYILAKKRCGYKIIDPDSYFLNVFRFLKKEIFWNCNYPTRFGWINIAPSGKIRSCTKKMEDIDLNFVDINVQKIKELKHIFKEGVSKCNRECYSNCAYDSWYFKNHQYKLFRELY